MRTARSACLESPSLDDQLQRDHHARVSDERYACIFRNLAKFDKQKQLLTRSCSVPIVRAALSRAQFKMNKNPDSKSTRLLCLTACRASTLPSLSLLVSLNGVQQSSKYREQILDGLWNYQRLNTKTERIFNRWLAAQAPHCSICYLFTANKSTRKHLDHSPTSLYPLLLSELLDSSSTVSDVSLECSMCHVTVHRQCYESLSLALDASISDDFDSWHCQRCTLRKQVTHLERERKRSRSRSLLDARRRSMFCMFTTRWSPSLSELIVLDPRLMRHLSSIHTFDLSTY